MRVPVVHQAVCQVSLAGAASTEQGEELETQSDSVAGCIRRFMALATRRFSAPAMKPNEVDWASVCQSCAAGGASIRPGRGISLRYSITSVPSAKIVAKTQAKNGGRRVVPAG